jgi:hypothetical protein
MILFDHLEALARSLGWNFRTERFGGRKIADQLEFGWLHDRQVHGLLAPEKPAGAGADLMGKPRRWLVPWLIRRPAAMCSRLNSFHLSNFIPPLKRLREARRFFLVESHSL